METSVFEQHTFFITTNFQDLTLLKESKIYSWARRQMH